LVYLNGETCGINELTFDQGKEGMGLVFHKFGTSPKLNIIPILDSVLVKNSYRKALMGISDWVIP
jgi:hypothetical protein